ncbi:unnamed protein product [Dibothriocephalus latus]|uniref:Helix-turn-helix domain-containing protein n=1 Tax=Dibothriocephalus latus TaxID=60516 RepID=A0A3P7NGY0_DIBLA|nr:unnamed protein product [Dibothriocephalus latus]
MGILISLGSNSVRSTTEVSCQVSHYAQLAFLDVLVGREDWSDPKTKVFSKATNTMQILNFNTNHPIRHKISCVRTLYRRGEKHCSEPEDKVAENSTFDNFVNRCMLKRGDAASLEKAEVAKRNLRQEEARLKQSTDAFMQVEPQRIAMLQNAAEIECEYYRKAAEAFQELQTALTQIKELALSNPEVSHGTEDYIHTPRQEFAYSTVIESKFC